jgi:hypothetical protein
LSSIILKIDDLSVPQKRAEKRIAGFSALVKSRFLLNRGGDCRFLDFDSRVLMDKNNEEASPMSTKDGFTPDHPLPVFLSEYSDEPEQPDIGNAWDTPVVSTRILKTSILGVTAAAIVLAILSAGNPPMLFANATAFLADISALKPGTDDSTPAIQPTAGAQALPPAASGAPTGDETAAALKTADQTADPVLNQFQAWAAEQDTRAQVAAAQPLQDVQPQPVQDDQPQPAQDAQPQIMQDAQPEPVEEARPQLRHTQKHRQVRHVQNARAEIPAEQNLRPKPRRKQNARVQDARTQDARAQGRPARDARTQERPVQDARTQDRSVQPVQNAQPPSLLQSLGFRD